MDSLLPQLLAFPPHPSPQPPLSDSAYDEGIKAQISTLRKSSEKTLRQQTSGGESPLDVINPALNTVPYTFILIAYMSAYSKHGQKVIKLESLWDKITIYLETFDARQMRYLGPEFIDVCDRAASISTNAGQRALCIAPIRDALLRLNPSGSVLTGLHIYLIKYALETRSYGVIAPIVEKPVLYYPGANDQLKPKYLCDLSLSPAAYITINSGFLSKLKSLDIMEYFYNSGMIMIGLRRWEDALDCLESVITYPAKEGAVSKVMIEAYKKWALVSILAEGKLLTLPKTTSSSAAKSYHVLAKPYEAVAQIFETGTASRLKAECDYSSSLWQKDSNLGLILQILNAYQRFQIRNLGKVYSKISIPELLNLTMSAETGNKLSGPNEMEALIRNMIQDGSLMATLSNPPGQPAVLAFDNKGPILTEAQMKAEFAAAAARISRVTQNIKQTDHMLTHEKEYIAHMKKQKASMSKFGTHDQGIGGEMDWNVMDDEELMTGVY
ncbi:COP9 signalosome complex subunit 3 [Hyphodiscus hymeniophilus]|uniref:COP9 signalosome complex subunit 3 n=1 Tax=Hyphodiscus hymeniophilus TaxID=353542 RepID=A0A9P7B089_9HELO|nr:COP9 signalosome complex subunit 3 [Hyphodiscus hymeniophilus]